MNIFILVNSYWEIYEPEYFLGPENFTQEQFNELCDSLLDTATQNAYSNRHPDNFIGNTEIVKEMVVLLKDKGFSHFIPKIYECFGASIFSDTSSFPKDKAQFISEKNINMVINHNGKVYKSIK